MPQERRHADFEYNEQCQFLLGEGDHRNTISVRACVVRLA